MIDDEKLAELKGLIGKARLAKAHADAAEAAVRVRVAELAIEHDCLPEDIQSDGTIRGRAPHG